MSKTKDPEVLEFEAVLLRSVGQAVRGEYAAVHTPEQIAARKQGRPVGTVKANAKVSPPFASMRTYWMRARQLGVTDKVSANDLLRADINAGRL